MKKKNIYIIIAVFLIIVVLGFVVAIIFPLFVERTKPGFPSFTVCTKMGCPCEGIEGERPCNSCKFSDPIFMLGFINVVKVCPAQEIIICERNVEVGKRLNVDKNNCEYKLTAFSPIVY